MLGILLSLPFTFFSVAFSEIITGIAISIIVIILVNQIIDNHHEC
jgi:hypothetical protein